AQVLGDALDGLAVEPGAEVLRDHAGRALAWLLHVSPPGQPRPHLNDSADGQAPDTAWLDAEARALGVQPRGDVDPYGEPRYVILRHQRTPLLLDAAPPSPPDLPCHPPPHS